MGPAGHHGLRGINVRDRAEVEFNLENEHVLKTVHRIEDGIKSQETVEWFNVQRDNDLNGVCGQHGEHVIEHVGWVSN